MTGTLHYMTIAELAAAIESKELSPVELTETLLHRIEAIDPQLNAFVTVTADQALAAARQAEDDIAAGRYRGPMHGIPFALKDIYDTKGVLTAGGSKTADSRIPDEDATTTAKLLDAGGILLGKLTTHEFAHGGPSFDLPWPPARNPWRTDSFTGGSSSGSGAAVAAGLAPMAMGSDTGGSIRTPAGLCGLAGIKPTYGLVSRFGVIPNSFTFDTCGPMTWTAEDCAISLQVLAGHDPRDPASADNPVPDYRAALNDGVRGLRIGAVRHFWEEDLPANDETRQSMETAIEVLRGLGATVEDVRLEPMQIYTDVKLLIAESELLSIHAPMLRERPEDFGFDFRGRVIPACLFTAEDYVRAQKARRRLVAAMAPIYERFDVLIAPSTYGPAQRLDDHSTVSFWQKPKITTVFNVTAGPALAICAGYSDDGLPLPMQIVGRPFDDATVLRVGHAFEQATEWRQRRPDLSHGADPLPVDAPPMTVDLSQVDAETERRVDLALARLGFDLPERIRDQALEGAPYAMALADRIPREDGFRDEPGNTWRFPVSG
ncbi:MAG: amidase [Alphaproteobacteria bacterium]|nr:amidase [Alphaproteobacteria bacterium]